MTVSSLARLYGRYSLYNLEYFLLRRGLRMLEPQYCPGCLELHRLYGLRQSTDETMYCSECWAVVVKEEWKKQRAEKKAAEAAKQAEQAKAAEAKIVPYTEIARRQAERQRQRL